MTLVNSGRLSVIRMRTQSSTMNCCTTGWGLCDVRYGFAFCLSAWIGYQSVIASACSLQSLNDE
eukprot:scaffold1736_cov127-Cylindrotheca_fusiformis.AAC.10